MSEYFDALETRDPAARELALLAALSRQVAHARTHAPYFAEALRDVDPQALTSREALAALPVTRKAQLSTLQQASAPLGGLNATPLGALRHIFQSPGPLHEPDGHGPDWWRTARAMYAAGFRRGELVYNIFSYHFTPAGMMMETARTGWAAACFRPASARPNRRCRRCRCCGRPPTPARRPS